jgi:hypothetical protein
MTVATRFVLSLRPKLSRLIHPCGSREPSGLTARQSEIEQTARARVGRAHFEHQRNDRLSRVMIEVCQVMDALAAADRNEDVAPPRLQLHAFGVHVPLRGVLDLHPAGVPQTVPHRFVLGRNLSFRLVMLDGDSKRLRSGARSAKPVCVKRLPNQPVEAYWAAVDGSHVVTIDREHERRAKCDKLRRQQLDEVPGRVDFSRAGHRRIEIDASGDVDSPAEQRRTDHLVVLHDR